MFESITIKSLVFYLHQNFMTCSRRLSKPTRNLNVISAPCTNANTRMEAAKGVLEQLWEKQIWHFSFFVTPIQIDHL